MRGVAIVALLLFAITLAVVAGTRMSEDALAVVVGIACGVAAGIPMSVLLLIALKHRDAVYSDASRTTPGTSQAAPYPPVVVIQGGTPVPSNALSPYYPSCVEAAPRRFRIIGEEED